MVTEDLADTDAISVFNSALPVAEKLERARTELLDLSARNRLLNIPQSARAARSLEVIDEHSGEVFRLLVRDSRPFTFIAGRRDAAADLAEQDAANESEEIAALAQPEDDTVDARGILIRHSDTKLQTRLTPVGLQKRLLDLYVDARTLEEEQGVNILYLALGTLKWIDPANVENVRYAPVIFPLRWIAATPPRSSSCAGDRKTPPPTFRLKRFSTRFTASSCPSSTPLTNLIQQRISPV